MQISSMRLQAMQLALERARLFRGATAPNPPVGAVGLDEKGQVLSVQAHERAGTPHAEVRVIQECREKGLLSRLHTVVVTLEPCNHHGRMPPCTDAILQTGVKRVIYGAEDPNPNVPGKGAERLRRAGVEVIHQEEPLGECQALIAPFSKWSRHGLPWVTVKTAFTSMGSMIPPPGQKTFTSQDSLRLAHELRKRADAILTGSGTVLADQPEFTVRHIADHPGKKRWLVVLDRRKRVPRDWVVSAESRGFTVITDLELEPAIRFLGKQGVLEVLVEAGPALTQAILSSSLWDENVIVTQQNNTVDRVEYVYRNR